jgi:hypothetical protein
MELVPHIYGAISIPAAVSSQVVGNMYDKEQEKSIKTYT